MVICFRSTEALRRLHCFIAALLLLLGSFYHNNPVSATVTQHDEGSDEYLIGIGSYDMTGPAAQIDLMGYARMGQTAHGIHQRLRARAFIVGKLSRQEDSVIEEEELSSQEVSSISRREGWKDANSGTAGTTLEQSPITQSTLDPNTTICFVSIDACMGSDLLNLRVVQRLQELLQLDQQQQPLCRIENLSISGTHTHSAPAGFLQYALYQITGFGFAEEVLHAYTEGVAQAIFRAYNNMERGSISIAKEWLLGASINRSPTSYLLNPEEERDEYDAEGDTDKTMLQVSFTSSTTGKYIGLLNWFAVHPTSMNSSNLLISGDNKGYASYLAERYWNGNTTVTGTGRFVAAFASTNLGDVSPNTAGPKCIDTGEPCDLETSACHGNCMLCRASGPGATMLESTEIIGRLQYEHSLKLLLEAVDNEPLRGSEVAFRQSFIDMSNLTVVLENGDVVYTCPAALGYSFASGTTDGPGDFPFTQGANTSNPFWNMVSHFLSIPDREQIHCQAPKPILLNVGKANLPYKWVPDVVPISIFRVGQLFILNVPAEFTTMAGRRLRKALTNVLVKNGIDDPITTIAGLANSYAGYVTTFEEYAGQRYEAASTLYGPHTLAAYIQEFERIASDLLSGASSATIDGPKDLTRKQLSLIPPVRFDTIGFGKSFGSVAIDANDEYKVGATVAVSFRSANPRINHRTEGTFLTVDILDEDGNWQTRYVDSDWCTQFHWKGGLAHWGASFAEIFWKIPYETPRGLYRICHYGTRKTLLSDLEVALYRAPAWLTSNVFGSYAVNIGVQSLKLAVRLSGKVRRPVSKAGCNRTKEFEGCSRTFLVH